MSDEDEPAATLGQEILRLRLKSGTTLRSFAESIEVSPAYVSDIEHDRRKPSDEVLRRIAKELRLVGATFEALDKLSARLDPATQRWVANSPEVRQMLREVKKSGQNPLDIIRILEERKQQEKRKK